MTKTLLKFIVFIAVASAIIISINEFRLDLIRNFQTYLQNSYEETGVLDDSGKLFFVLNGAGRAEPIPLDQISPHFIKAVLALEDKRYYSHFGVDLYRIIGAVYYFFKNPDLAQGASTITQQLMKNTVLSHEKTFKRKFLEMLYALSIETVYSKDRILEMYLNTIYLGNGYYGIEKASKGYFGVPSAALDIAESALLAGMIKKPVGYNPLQGEKYSELANRRKVIAIKLMFKNQWITQSQAEHALGKNITFIRAEKERANENEFFSQWVIMQAEKLLGADLVHGQGVNIYSTLNSEYQRKMQETLRNSSYYSQEKNEAAGVAVDYRTGWVKAMVGGRNYVASQFNKATQAYRQVGSAFKPFLYALAFDSGVIKPDDILIDEPTDYFNVAEDGSESYYFPENYGMDYKGELTAREALVLSNNIISVKILDKVGIAKLVQFVDRIGLKIDRKRGLCNALGCSEQSLINMVSAYGIFPNGGIQKPLVFITKITDKKGKILYEYKPDEVKAVISPETAALMTGILSDIIADGTGKLANPFINNLKVGGKTGTTDSFRDAWFLGFTDDFVMGFWVGNEDNSPTEREVGGGTTALLWRDTVRSMYNAPNVDKIR